MSTSVAMDQIIQPAPAQTAISSNPSRLTSTSNQPNNDEREPREKKIKSLITKLRMISNVAGTAGEYVKFQRSMSPDIRIVLDVNQWMMLMLIGKATIKNIIDQEYMEISEPPPQLKQAMEKAYASIDSAYEAFSCSMKEILILAQSRLSQPNSTTRASSNATETNILSAMTETDVSRHPALNLP